MAKIPAICQNCNTLFVKTNVIGGKGAVKIRNSIMGPCPKCGGMGRIPDGIYDFIGDSIELLSATSYSVADLNRLKSIFADARSREATFNDIKSQVKQEIPVFEKVTDLLPRTRNDLYAFIMIILTIISLVITARNRKETPKIEINQVINNIHQVVNIRRSSRKIGRNELCPCGSGMKYKKCCMKE